MVRRWRRVGDRLVGVVCRSSIDSGARRAEQPVRDQKLKADLAGARASRRLLRRRQCARLDAVGAREPLRELIRTEVRQQEVSDQRMVEQTPGRGRALVVKALLGAAVVGGSFVLYTMSTRLPAMPVVDGAGEIYVSDPAVVTAMSVTTRQPVGGQTPVDITLAFYREKAVPAADTFAWALVLYGDARFDHPEDLQRLVRPPATQITTTRAGDPPFRLNPRQPVQVIHGAAQFGVLEGRGAAVTIRGWIPITDSRSSGPKLAVALPRYGRARFNPLFAFPNTSGALDLGVPGAWQRPDRFDVMVDTGYRLNGTGQRIDVASPGLDQGPNLRWRDADSVQVLLLRTDLAAEGRQQAAVFGLGALVGAGAAFVLEVVETLLGARRVRAGRGSRSATSAAAQSRTAD